MTRSATDHSSEAATGCCMGQAWMLAEGLGLPHSWRAAAVTALTGFQSAMTLEYGRHVLGGDQCVGDEGQGEEDDEADALR